jgi:hypothetical protein
VENKILHSSLLNTFTSGSKIGQLTGKAYRQRETLRYLIMNLEPNKRTRISISRYLTLRTNGRKWNDMYSAIFRDVDKYLIPLGLIQEEGRVFPKRGSKQIQVDGIPYFKITEKGIKVMIEIENLENK